MATGHKHTINMWWQIIKQVKLIKFSVTQPGPWACFCWLGCDNFQTDIIGSKFKLLFEIISDWKPGVPLTIDTCNWQLGPRVLSSMASCISTSSKEASSSNTLERTTLLSFSGLTKLFNRSLNHLNVRNNQNIVAFGQVQQQLNFFFHPQQQ